MFEGDINLSCTMTFLSTLASFACTTFWVWLLGTPLVGKTIPIPYLQMVISLASFTVPLIIGVAVKYKFPKQSAVIRQKISRPFFLICLIILPVMGTTANLHFFYLCTWRHLVSGACVGLLGYLFGAGVAWIFCQDRPKAPNFSI